MCSFRASPLPIPSRKRPSQLHGARGRGLGDDGGVHSHDRARHGGLHRERDRLGQRADHRPDERALPLLAVPRVVVVGDPQRGEPGLLRHSGLLHQLGGRVLLAGQEVAVFRHADSSRVRDATRPSPGGRSGPGETVPGPRVRPALGTPSPATLGGAPGPRTRERRRAAEWRGRPASGSRREGVGTPLTGTRRARGERRSKTRTGVMQMPDSPASAGRELDARAEDAERDGAGPGTANLGGAGLDGAGLERALRERVDGEVRFDAGSRGAYSTDGSNYRQVPIGVVVPRTVDAAVAAVAVCAEFGAPGPVARRRHQPGGAVHQHGGRHRLDQVLRPPGLGRPRPAHLRRRARHRAGRTQPPTRARTS